jgi:hypothetical protein
MSALSPEQRERHRALAGQLRSAVIEFKEIPHGYAARLPSDPATVVLAAEFMTLERLCCPFFCLAVEIASENGPLWLKVTGPDGIKPFIRAEFSIPPET